MGQKLSLQKSVHQTLDRQMDLIQIQIGNELINDFDISPDNNSIALACDHIRICDISQQLEIAQLKHNTYVIKVKYSPDSQYIASSDVESFIIIWDAKTNKKIYKMHTHFVYYNLFKFSTDSQIITSGSDDLQVKIWQYKQDKNLILKHRNQIAAIEYLSNQVLTVGYFNGDVQFWNLKTIKFLKTFMQNGHRLNSLHSSANGRQILSACPYGTMKYQDTKSKRIIRKLSQNMPRRYMAALSPDSQLIASSFPDKEQIQIYCSMSAQLIQEISFENSLQIMKLQFSQNNKYILWKTNDYFKIAKLNN